MSIPRWPKTSHPKRFIFNFGVHAKVLLQLFTETTELQIQNHAAHFLFQDSAVVYVLAQISNLFNNLVKYTSPT